MNAGTSLAATAWPAATRVSSARGSTRLGNASASASRGASTAPAGASVRQTSNTACTCSHGTPVSRGALASHHALAAGDHACT